MRTFRTWANEVHLAAKDVPELWYLVDAKLANHTADAGGAVVIRAGPDRPGFLRVGTHRAKLHHHKRAAVFSHDAYRRGESRAGLGVGTHRAKLHHHKRAAVFSHAFLLVKN